MGDSLQFLLEQEPALADAPVAPVLAQLEEVARKCQLTEREKRILPFVALGVPRTTIAAILQRSVWTVRAQIASIRAKERRSARGDLAKLGHLFGVSLLELLKSNSHSMGVAETPLEHVPIDELPATLRHKPE